MTPEATLTFWKILARARESELAGKRQRRRFQIWNESQAGVEGFPEDHLAHLQSEGYLEKYGVGRRLSATGLQIEREFYDPLTRHKFLRRVVFAAFQLCYAEPHEIEWEISFTHEYLSGLGITKQDLLRAVQGLEALKLIVRSPKLDGEPNAYTLTPKGIDRCLHGDRLLADLSADPYAERAVVAAEKSWWGLKFISPALAALAAVWKLLTA